MISALPDVKHITISPEDEFMIIACDGIWNFMTSQQVIDFVRIRINDGREKMSTICEEVRTTHWLTVCDGTHLCFLSLGRIAVYQLSGQQHDGRRYRLRQHDRGHCAFQAGLASATGAGQQEALRLVADRHTGVGEGQAHQDRRDSRGQVIRHRCGGCCGCNRCRDCRTGCGCR